METEATSPPGNVERRHDPKRAKTPHTIHLREWNMPDGRKLLVDRRAVAFICEGKPEEVPGKVTTIVAFRTLTKACPVLAPYDAVKAWWLGTPPRS